MDTASTCTTVVALMFSLTKLATFSANIVLTDLKVLHTVASSGGGRNRSIGHGTIIACLMISAQISGGRVGYGFMVGGNGVD